MRALARLPVVLTRLELVTFPLSLIRLLTCRKMPLHLAYGLLSPALVRLSQPQVGLTRLELVTFPLSEGCSNRLSYRPGIALCAMLGSVPPFGRELHRLALTRLLVLRCLTENLRPYARRPVVP